MNLLPSIPWEENKALGEKYKYSQVIIVAFDNEEGTTSVSTWGNSDIQSEQAAIGGNMFRTIMGFDPETLPVRVQSRIEELEKQLEELQKSS